MIIYRTDGYLTFSDMITQNKRVMITLADHFGKI